MGLWLIRLPACVTLLALLISVNSAYGYNEAGHFYSVIAVDHGENGLLNGPAHEAAVVTALCSQIPDLSKELDAVTLRVNLLADPGGWVWGAFSACTDGAVDDMDEVHHYVHALTDSPAAPVHAAAIATLQRLWKTEIADPSDVNACAVGIALHLLGDSYAHIRLNSTQGKERMYPPGMGHFRDNHNPDYIVFNATREAAWENYIATVASSTAGQLDGPYSSALFQLIRGDLSGGNDDNFFHTYDIVQQIDGFIARPAGDSWQPWTPKAPPVEALYGSAGWWDSHVLSMSFDDVIRTYIPTHADTLHFATVWWRYRAVAREEFAKRGVKAKCDSD